MKKSLVSLVFVMALVLSFTSCRENKKGDNVNITIEETANETEGALEEAGKAIDNVVKEVKEVGEATEKAIEKVDGDN